MGYKVLWIDDDYSIVDAYQTIAEEEYNIDLIHMGNWEDGKKYLIDNFNEISAIIFDANCKLKPDGVIEGNIFLATVTLELQQLFGERNNVIPWYILSAGRGEDFEPITRCVTAARKSFNDDWGEAIFLKDAIEESDENPLFKQICKVGATQEQNIILYRHHDTFQYLGKKDYLSINARIKMLDVLTNLYHPTDNLDIEKCGNSMRKIIEFLFKHARVTGILPDAFFDSKGAPNIAESMCFLCGKPANSVKMRLWDKENNKSYSLFSQSEYHQFCTVLEFTNKSSHALEDFLTKDLCLGIALILCHLITVYGKFIDSHKDIHSIREMWTTVEGDKPTSKNHNNGKNDKLINHTVEGCVQYSSGLYHIGDVKVPLKYRDYYGTSKLFRIEIVLKNEDKTKDKFPYYTLEKNIIEIK